MYIANPIYDTVFKHLMENNRVARFFVETIINQPVERIVVSPQEYTLLKVPPTLESKEMTQEEIKKIAELMSVMRYDFLATIRTPEGHKKVLIEIQKAKNAFDLMRFRNYVGDQYKRKDIITVNGEEIKEPLPIITIYLLGFELPETDAIVIHVSRTYHDVIAKRVLHVKCDFIECLTHDSYVVQIPKIEGKKRSRLEKMLNVFEQNDFYDKKRILKNFRHEVGNDKNIREMIEILCHVGADPAKREEIELEWRSNEFIDEYLSQKENLVLQKQEILMQKQMIEEKDKTLADNAKTLADNAKTLAEKDKTLAEKDKIIAELLRKVNG